MTFIQYILIASVCLSLFYLAYRLIYHHERNFRQLRIFLMGSILLSLLLPFNSYTIDFLPEKPAGLTFQSLNVEKVQADQSMTLMPRSVMDWQGLLLKVYFLIALLLAGRIVWQLAMLTLQFVKAEKIKQNDCVILLHHRFRNTFSFFNWIFINPNASSQEDLQQIIAHEKIHASQYHSVDLIVVELLTAVMWFNPLIWMMRNSVQLVHEYLADEGALNSGIDRLRYQALLINQVTEERLVCLSSSFNHSLIKKRMKMMTHNDAKQRSRLKIMVLLPLAVTLFLATAIVNSFFPEKARAVAPTSSSMPEYVLSSGSEQLSELNSPQDTIRKKTIVRVISKDNPKDTVITETEEIILTDDASKAIWVETHSSGNADGQTKKLVFISEDGNTQHLSTDSSKMVKVIRHETAPDNGENIIIIRKSAGTNSTTSEMSWTNSDDPDNTLIIIDGEKQKSKHAMSIIDPDVIESISVIKDKKMIKTYTDQDYEGVIVIVTKKGEK